MNRSILIVICDFLLVTLVAFSNFDTDKLEQPETRIARAPTGIGGNQDMMGTLKLALEDEKQTREKLTSDLRAQEQAAAEREEKIKEFQASLRRTEEQAKQIETQRAALAQQAAAAQSSLQDVQSKLSSVSAQNLVSQEKLASLQADLKK